MPSGHFAILNINIEPALRTKLLSRGDAISRGEGYYFTGFPCFRGHIANRRVRTSDCVECDRVRSRHNSQRRRDDHQAWASSILWAIKSRSRKNGIPFNLTAEHIFSLIPADGICPALGIPLIFGKKLSRNSPSIDRMVPAIGYVLGNVAIISNKANSMKQDCADSSELRRLADFMDRRGKCLTG